MKISYKWLKDYVNLDVDPKILEDHLTFAGIEVEAIEHIGEDLKQFIVAEVLSAQKIEGSDHLQVCMVNDGGEEPVQVVCGAPNCRTGLKVAFAPVGSIIGGEFKIKKAKLKGYASHGMICSAKELGISEDHDGIMELDTKASIGQDLASYLDFNDIVYDVEITPNRPDLLGIIGVARDLSALYHKELHLPQAKEWNTYDDVNDSLKLEIQNQDKCSRYLATVIKNVEVKESPDWLKKRLIAVELRPINNIVDITNFILMETGHPIHAFDYDKLAGKKIIVRDAFENESFPALNGEVYKLSQDDLVIADGDKAIGLAGVMGGANSEITLNTQNIVIESACFNYATVRRTSQRHKLFSDSSYRFERGLSSETPVFTKDRAIDLILDLAGGQLQQGSLDVYPNPDLAKIEVELRPARVELLLGAHIPLVEIKSYLKALGLELITESSEKIKYKIPHFRGDLLREIDLIEEIVRLHGYNNIPVKTSPQGIMNHKHFRLERKIKDLMVTAGLYEVINLTLFDPDNLNKLRLSEDDFRRRLVELKNPQSNVLRAMRTTLITNLLNCTEYNINRGNKDVRIFELNKIILNNSDKTTEERKSLTALLSGNRFDNYWKDKSTKCDFYDVKGIVEDLFTEVNLTISYTPSQEKFYTENHSLDIICKKLKIGSFGQIDPKIAKSFNIDTVELKQDVYILDIDLTQILEIMDFSKRDFQEINKFPNVYRDISFNVNSDIKVSDIISTIEVVNKAVVKNVSLMDEYKGKNIPKGKRSLMFSLTLNSENKTLTDKFTEQLMQKVIQSLEKNYNIEMR
ncbi:phenylalanine--tRNA ligase subunit beta [bacterium]|nr:phenylalanine--tRNA ligase subunit beta [bacterium]